MELGADPFMTALGLQTEVLGPGRARVWGKVQPHHVNMLGSTHGGFIYSLADGAFALASNSHGVPAVALSTHIEYFEAGREGDELEAVAEEIYLGYRTAHYRVEVRRAATLIAVFTGTVYRRQMAASK
jgi:acyl-CoA thioesterase